MAISSGVGVSTLIVVAAIGGFTLNMMNLWEDSKKPANERVPKDLLYWVFFVFWPVAGGGLAWLYAIDGSTLRPLLAFSIGLSAPTTVQAMISKASAVTGPPSGAEN
ncbi:DUF1129 domain-containing protein [Burkholderia pseudomallei]|uniref:DUF1129 domain-containing protein n=1 Tax=Burkholderia pseudomallei TaxID=28450 RepID=UPI0011C4B09C|nr:DUF1129 domain-containing protein [Burkholderia pseudomallei]